MGRATEVLVGKVATPGAVVTAVAGSQGDTFQVRAFPETSAAWLYGMWGQTGTSGVLRVTSPKLHDNTQGIRVRNPAGTVRNAFPDWLRTRLYPTDTLVPAMSGDAAGTDSMSLLMYYEDLDGADQKLLSYQEWQAQGGDVCTVDVPVAGPTVAGDWSAGTVINTFSDLLEADTRYAVLGYQTDTECNAVGLRAPDFSNLRVGGPGPTESIETRDWFVSLAAHTQQPFIPVFKANNKGATLAFVAKNTAAGTVNVTFMLQQLKT